MNLRLKIQKRQQGISLVEALVYMACLAILLSVISLSFWKLKSFHDRTGARADLVAKLLAVGESWRAEIRNAKSVAENQNAGVRYARDGKPCDYSVIEGKLVRTVAGKSDVLLQGVVASSMQPLERQGVRYWQWDVTVVSAPGYGVVQQFSFLAVPLKD